MTKNLLKTYRTKRKFSKTTEPKGTVDKKHDEPIFVIHEHKARSLHYDLRLEDEGVLKSWAIPKGPSTDPHEKHLAIMTENHPYEYADFEGIIEEGNYGAGNVIIWDRGTFRNLKDRPLKDCIKEGTVAVWLNGKKLHGGYALVRTHFSKNSWLFFKMKDAEAEVDHNILKEMPKSVISGKTVEEIGPKKKARR